MYGVKFDSSHVLRHTDVASIPRECDEMDADDQYVHEVTYMSPQMRDWYRRSIESRASQPQVLPPKAFQGAMKVDRKRKREVLTEAEEEIRRLEMLLGSYNADYEINRTRSLLGEGSC